MKLYMEVRLISDMIIMEDTHFGSIWSHLPSSTLVVIAPGRTNLCLHLFTNNLHDSEINKLNCIEWYVHDTIQYLNGHHRWVQYCDFCSLSMSLANISRLIDWSDPYNNISQWSLERKLNCNQISQSLFRKHQNKIQIICQNNFQLGISIYMWWWLYKMLSLKTLQITHA